MTQSGIVKKILSARRALVEVARPTACGQTCAACGMCVSAGQSLTTEADNPMSASVGDRVTISSETGRILGLAALVYLLPIVSLLLGALLPPAGTVGPVVGALGGLTVGLLVVWTVSRLMRRQVRVVITSIETGKQRG